ncbi:MAG: DUF393 domain-containing protein [Chloroflexi bacterium]|nr:DUF393 domain-containing protein [Chloroflexota bacterium]
MCTRFARLLRRLDRDRRLHFVPLQTAAGLAGTPPLHALLETLHVRAADGPWVVGGAALLRISQEVPLLRPIGFFARLPILRGLVEPAYALVAANRHRISRVLGADACRIDPSSR